MHLKYMSCHTSAQNCPKTSCITQNKSQCPFNDLNVLLDSSHFYPLVLPLLSHNSLAPLLFCEHNKCAPISRLLHLLFSPDYSWLLFYLLAALYRFLHLREAFADNQFTIVHPFSFQHTLPSFVVHFFILYCIDQFPARCIFYLFF